MNTPLTVLAQLSIDTLPQVNAGSSQLESILRIVFTITGALAVLFMVAGGMRYITAQGDPQQLSQAKGTIIYALVGLLVSISAVAIVTFVLGRIA